MRGVCHEIASGAIIGREYLPLGGSCQHSAPFREEKTDKVGGKRWIKIKVRTVDQVEVKLVLARDGRRVKAYKHQRPRSGPALLISGQAFLHRPGRQSNKLAVFAHTKHRVMVRDGSDTCRGVSPFLRKGAEDQGSSAIHLVRAA
jgi:hypothetical protein